MNDDEISTKPICAYYKNIYKRMVIWFGYTYPYWLCDMDQEELLTCILNLNMKHNMYFIFLNVAIRIRINNNRNVEILEEYKKNNTNVEKLTNRRVYYNTNIDKIKVYNQQYHQMKKQLLGINLFSKNNNTII